jgi:hypothetical protein
MPEGAPPLSRSVRQGGILISTEMLGPRSYLLFVPNAPNRSK